MVDMTEDQRRSLTLAAAAAKARGAAEPEKTGFVSGIADRLTEGFLLGGGDEYLAGLSSVLGLQPDGQGGSEFFQYDKPIGERYSTALGAIREERGQFAEEHPIAGNVAEVGGAVGGAFLPIRYLNTLGKGFQTASTTGKVARVAGQSALGGGIYGALSAEGGPGNRAIGGAGGAGVGLVAGPLTYGATRGIMGVIGKASGPIARKLEQLGLKATDLDSNGQFTERGRNLLRSNGIDPDQVAEDIRGYYVRAARAAAEGASPEDITRAADIKSLGITPTMGQATGDVIQQGEELAMAAGARGAKPAQIMGETFDTQKAQLARAGQGVSPQVTGGPFRPTTFQDAGDVVTEAIPRLAEDARTAGRQAYQTLEGAGAAFSGEAFEGFGDRVGTSLKMTGAQIGPNTPQAAGALASISQRFDDVARTGSVPFSEVEAARQTLNTYYAAAQKAGGGDLIATKAVLREFDDSVESMFKNALIEGDAGTLELAKEARALWAKYKQTFATKTGIDRKIMQLADGDASPNEVISWFFGLSRHIGGGQTSRAMTRLKSVLGSGSDEFLTMKQAAFNHMTDASQAKITDRASFISSNIKEFLDGKGRAMSRIMFSPSELGALREFGNRASRLIINPDAINRSGTGHENARALASLADAAATAIGFKIGGPGGALAARAASKSTRGVNAAIAAKLAAQGPTSDAFRYIPVYTVPRAATRAAGGAGGELATDLFGAQANGR